MRQSLIEIITKKLEKIQLTTELSFLAEKVKNFLRTNQESLVDNKFLEILDDFLTQLIEFLEKDSIRFLYNIHKEIISRIEHFFYSDVIGQRHLIYINMKPDNIINKHFLQFSRELSITIVNQKYMKFNHIWCFASIGHFIGNTLLHNIPDLRESLRERIKNAFDNRTEFIECLQEVYPDLEAKQDMLSQIMSISVHFHTRDKEGNVRKSKVEEYFLNAVNSIHKDKRFSNNTPEQKGILKIEFLKHLWLHWLDSCFSDVISLMTCDAPSLFSLVHEHKLFQYETVNVPGIEENIIEEKLIDDFLGLSLSPPIYIRFRFMLSVLDYIEKQINRQYTLADKIENRLQPVINVILEKKNIKGYDLDNYRFQSYWGNDISFSINIDFVEKMHTFIIKKIFDCLDEFINKHLALGNVDWLKQITFKDWELKEIDDLIYQLLSGEKNITFHQYRHILTAGRYAFEISPRKAMIINKNGLTSKQREPDKRKVENIKELPCINYYFNRESYWDWYTFSLEMDKLLSSLTNNPLSYLSSGLASCYKSDFRYNLIINHLKNLINSIDTQKDRDLLKKIGIMINHYHSFKEVRQYNAILENDIEHFVLKKSDTKNIIQKIIDHEYFHKILNALIETNHIKIEFLDSLEKSLFSLSKDEYQKLPLKLSHNYPKFKKAAYEIIDKLESALSSPSIDNFHEYTQKLFTKYSECKKTTSDSASLIILYESGEIFNFDKYYEAIDNWYENRGNTRQIHQEAWKGKIIGKIKAKIFHLLKAKNFSKENSSPEKALSMQVQEWISLFMKSEKTKDDKDELKALSLNLEKVITDKIESFSNETAEYIQIIKESIKEVCIETQLWIHYKNVRYIYNKLVTFDSSGDVGDARMDQRDF